MKSKFLNLHWKDIFKGFLMAFIGAFLTALYTALEAGEIPTTWDQWKSTILVGAGAGIAYLLKNFFTNSNDEVLKTEPKDDTGII